MNQPEFFVIKTDVINLINLHQVLIKQVVPKKKHLCIIAMHKKFARKYISKMINYDTKQKTNLTYVLYCFKCVCTR